jgi:hypothetical protein
MKKNWVFSLAISAAGRYQDDQDAGATTTPHASLSLEDAQRALYFRRHNYAARHIKG